MPGVISVQIPANETRSGMADLGGNQLAAIEMPEALNGTVITFQSKSKNKEDITNSVGAQQADEDWDDVYDSAGNQISWTVAGGRIVVPTAAHAEVFAALRYLRIITATAQNPAREFRFIVKENG